MVYVYSIVLFLITFIGGSAPLWTHGWTESRMKYLLAFSGAFLLCITFLHLIPESVHDLGPMSGILLIVGFFGQQLIQKFTHGVEHGHFHGSAPHAQHRLPVWSVFIGLSLHAFSEGLPFGIHYTDPATLPALFVAVGLHKMPEAMLIISLFYQQNKSISKSVAVLVLFSLVTPLSGLGSLLIRTQLPSVGWLLHWCIPLIAGAFIQIATTIFYESGTKAHEMTLKKWLVIVAGVALGFCSLLTGFIAE